MKAVYSTLLDDMSYQSLKRLCGALSVPVVNKRQFLKCKKKIVSVVSEKVNKHLVESSHQVIKYYGEVLDRHPDENGFLDVDVTYDGKLYPHLVFCTIKFIFIYLCYVKTLFMQDLWYETNLFMQELWYKK